MIPPPTKEECEQWKTNTVINPRTNRKIKLNGPTYTALKNACKRNSISSNPEDIKDNSSPSPSHKVDRNDLYPEFIPRDLL